MYHSVAEGILDGMVSSWAPKTHKKYLQEFKGKIDNLGASLKGAKIGLVIPDYVGVKSIKDLALNSSLFRDKKIYAIDETSGVTIAANQALKEYKLEGWTVEAVGLNSVTANLRNAVEQKRPIVVTGWKPHWMFEEFSIRFLNDPKKIFGSAEEIHTIASPYLKRNNPQVYNILKGIKFDMQEYTKMMWKIHNGESPEAIARKYVDNLS